MSKMNSVRVHILLRQLWPIFFATSLICLEFSILWMTTGHHDWTNHPYLMLAQTLSAMLLWLAGVINLMFAISILTQLKRITEDKDKFVTKRTLD